ncbi:MAG: hypothetical protein J6Y07_02255 [Alphaproteobacteria bacterium]|nr:hypothetical protein [Alphaproteobacteria bacterium]
MTDKGLVFKREYVLDSKFMTREQVFHFKLAGDMLPIKTDNAQSDKIEHATLHLFPGNGIYNLIDLAPKLSKVVAEQDVWTVLEFWDRDNKQPVAWLYATGRTCSVSKKLETDMNPATLADWEKECTLRRNWAQTARNSK